MRIQGDMVALSKTAALRIVEKQLGFPKPSPRFLHWYFRRENQEYLPRVNFDALAQDIQKENIIETVATVAGLAPNDEKKLKYFVRCERLCKGML
jgi:hypothetical protein